MPLPVCLPPTNDFGLKTAGKLESLAVFKVFPCQGSRARLCGPKTQPSGYFALAEDASTVLCAKPAHTGSTHVKLTHGRLRSIKFVAGVEFPAYAIISGGRQTQAGSLRDIA